MTMPVPVPARLTAAADPALDATVMRAAAAGEQVGGNIGDRDHVRYPGADYDLVEAQAHQGDFGSWRVYLVDRSAMTRGGWRSLRMARARRSPTLPLRACAIRRAVTRSW